MSRFNLGYHLSSRRSLFNLGKYPQTIDQGLLLQGWPIFLFPLCLLITLSWRNHRCCYYYHDFGEQSINYLKHARLAQRSNPYHLTGQNESAFHELLSTSKSICRSGRVRKESSPSVFGAQTAASTFSVTRSWILLEMGLSWIIYDSPI